MNFRSSFLVALVGTLILFLPSGLEAQSPQPSSSAHIYESMCNWGKTARVLYVAAHPDDENTRLIASLSRGEHVETAYLSLTRGDGGQNLIGTEIGPLIGVLRSQELMQARRIDGGRQFFTRAVDFGYSKNPEETFELWNRDSILNDVVWVIRTFRPDVIITRFPPTSYAGHGHHTASAILCEEAFDLSGDPKAFPHQLKYVQPHQPKRLYFNASSWWNPEIAEEAKTNDDFLVIDVSKYDPLRGVGYAEIAAESRSQHRSQGFGSEVPLGQQLEYLKFVKGEKAQPQNGLFDGITTDWSRFWGGETVAQLHDSLLNSFNFLKPEASLEILQALRRQVTALETSPFIQYRLTQLDALAAACAGIRIRAYADRYRVTAGDSVEVTADVFSGLTDSLVCEVRCNGKRLAVTDTLRVNKVVQFKGTMAIPEVESFGNAYWIHNANNFMFNSGGYPQVGSPENNALLTCEATVKGEGLNTVVRTVVDYRYVDRARGELHRPLSVLPAATVNFSEELVILNDSTSMLKAKIERWSNQPIDEIRFVADAGIEVTPQRVHINHIKAGELIAVDLEIKARVGASGSVRAEIPEGKPAFSVTEVSYDHIPAQLIATPAVSEVRRFNLTIPDGRIAYISGPGDEVAAMLRQAGAPVDVLLPEAIATADLHSYKAVLVGIRAYNTSEALRAAHPLLLNYVEQGGNLIIQYVTTAGAPQFDLGPYPFKLSRNRVTDERAPVTFLEKDHPLVNFPNKLTEADFNGWVQERGLYFASEWDEAYTPLLSWNDPGEDPQAGSLLFATYGRGTFMYTGISFFRQLPAGVEGAYKLLTNMLYYNNGPLH